MDQVEGEARQQIANAIRAQKESRWFHAVFKLNVADYQAWFLYWRNTMSEIGVFKRKSLT